MSSAERLDKPMSEEEYLAWERQQPVRHEFYRGEVFLQAGGTRKHSLIASNVLRTIGNQLEGHHCEAHGSDLRIHVKVTGYYAYPDVSVICPPIESEAEDIISNPVLVAEVLSPSTADFDRGGQFGHYRQIPSLQEYLVFWQDEARVEHHRRTANNKWILEEIAGREQSVRLETVGFDLPLRQAYDKVLFDS